jgi:hypothetical protein
MTRLDSVSSPKALMARRVRCGYISGLFHRYVYVAQVAPAQWEEIERYGERTGGSAARSGHRAGAGRTLGVSRYREYSFVR